VTTVAVHCERAGVSTTGLRAADQKRHVLRAYYLAGLAMLPAAAQLLQQSLGDGRFVDGAAHAAGIAAATAAGPEAARAAARRSLPALPAGANVNMRVLEDHLYTEMPGFIMLYMAQRNRSPDPRGAVRSRIRAACDACTANGHPFCRCAHQHRWMTAQKAVGRSMFMRPQAYQKSCLLDVMQSNIFLQHPSVDMAELLVAMKLSCHAVTLYGDTHSCEAVSEQQENQVVRILKAAIVKCWSQHASATARARVASYTHVQEVLESAAGKEGQAGRQKAVGLVQHDKEEAALAAMLVAADAFAADVAEVGSKLHVAGDPSTALLKPEVLYFRRAAAQNKWMTASEAQRQGFDDGVRMAVKLPSWDVPVPRHVATVRTAAECRTRAKEEKAQQKARAAQMVKATMDATDSVFLAADTAMLTRGGIGENKAEVAMQLLERFGQCGKNDDGFMPVNIFKNDAEHIDFMEGIRGIFNPCKYVLVVDGPQFLQADPFMPAGTVRTLTALARATIRMFGAMLKPHHIGSVVCMDAPPFITWLRSLVHEKRGKVQSSGDIQEAQFAKMRGDSELDTTIAMLLRSKEGFLPKFLAEIKHQLHNPCAADGWDAADIVANSRFLAFVMPEKSAIFISGGRSGRGGRSFELMGTTLTAEDLRTCIDGSGARKSSVIAEQGQGEAMLFKFTLRWLAVLLRKGGVRLAERAGLDLICQDADALSGYLMPCIMSVLASFATHGVANVAPTLSILLTVRSKDDRKLERLGLLAQQRAARRCISPATGDLLTVVVDALALYKAIEADDAAPKGADGTRAIGCTTLLLSVAANDLKRGLHGIGAAKLFGAFFSPRFKDFIAAKRGQHGELVTITTPPAASDDMDELPSCLYKLAYWGTAALL
jgi:hypothetical protein